MRRALPFAGGVVETSPDWPEDFPSGIVPTSRGLALMDAWDDEDTTVMQPRPSELPRDTLPSGCEDITIDWEGFR